MCACVCVCVFFCCFFFVVFFLLFFFVFFFVCFSLCVYLLVLASLGNFLAHLSVRLVGIIIGRFCHPPCLMCVFIASLTLTMLWADSADNNWMIFFKIFPENRV